MMNEELEWVQMVLFLRYSPHNDCFYPLMDLIVVYAIRDFRIERISLDEKYFYYPMIIIETMMIYWC